MTSVYFLRWGLFFSLLVSIACSDSVQRMTQKAVNASAHESIIEPQFLASDNFYGGSLLARPAVEMFYASRHYKPVWLNGATFYPQGDSLLNILHSAVYFGLLPSDYHLMQINVLAEKRNKSTFHYQDIAALDVLMTDALITIGHHIRYGRVQKDTLYRFNALPEIDSALTAMLIESVNRNNIREALEAAEPAHAAYRILKQDLKRKVDSLSAAQESEMTSILEHKIRQLAVNMEKWRWEDNVDGRYIFVNIPSFKLEIVQDDTTLFESNVVVGTTNTPTPQLDGLIKSFVLFPSWNVPRQIAIDELLPKIKNDTSYLEAHHYRVFDIGGNKVHPDSVDWSRYNTDNFPFQLQQSEGDYNALGIIKFVFQNDYNVYLHDTNAKRFFKKALRANSHGCVRVEKAIEMAQFLLSEGNPYCSPDDLEQYIEAGQQRLVCVNPIDLRIRYYTCEARKDGSVYFHPDVYSRDGQLMEALYCRSN